MRLLSLVIVVGLVAACKRPSDVTGVYVRGPISGAFFPCDEPATLWQVGDSALAAAYQRTATRPYELLFAHLRGVRTDSSGTYGPMGHGRYHFRVQQVVEIRTRRAGECPMIVDTVSTIFQH